MIIWMTSGTFVELGEIQKRGAFENIGSEARCNIVVNYTNDGSKLTNLELTGEANVEGDAVYFPQKKGQEGQDNGGRRDLKTFKCWFDSHTRR